MQDECYKPEPLVFQTAQSSVQNSIFFCEFNYTNRIGSQTGSNLVSSLVWGTRGRISSYRRFVNLRTASLLFTDDSVGFIES